MKKVFLSLATVALALGSCTNQEVIDVPQGAAIGFETFVGKATRADVTTENLEKMYVYGGYADNVKLFDGQEVTKSGSAWTYTPLRYWVENGAYVFAAANEQVGALDYTKKELTISGYTVSGTSDLVVATVVEQTGAASGNNAVPFTFKHALSKVTLKFISEWDQSAKVEVTDIKLNTVATTNTLTASTTQLTWGTASTETGSYDYEELDLTNTNNAAQVEGNIETKYLLPQTLTNVTLSFTVTVTTTDKDGEDKVEKREISINLTDGKDNDSQSVDAWAMGYVYNYSLVLNGKNVLDETEPIEFTVTTVENWNTDEKDVDLTQDDYNGTEPLD